MDRPAPDPVKLLEVWMEWERGDTPPGRVISNLKTAGLRDLLERLALEVPATGRSNEDLPDAADWKPLV
jgi:hypothetical protein